MGVAFPTTRSGSDANICLDLIQKHEKKPQFDPQKALKDELNFSHILYGSRDRTSSSCHGFP